MTATPVVVLVEGKSDAVVLSRLVERRRLQVRVQVMAMGGVTNVGHHVRRLAAASPGATVLALGDVGERRFLERAAPSLDGLFLCVRDLEEELIRAVGPDRVTEVLAELGELERFRTFQGQPWWRDRPPADQLRRFAGTRSGRKELLAGRLAEELTLDRLPAPLAGLLERAEAAGRQG